MFAIKTMRYALPALTAAVLLGGCTGAAESTAEDEAPPVASLRSADPAASRPAGPDDQRPLVPLDATDSERNALVDVWMRCISAEGGPGYENPKVVFQLEHEGDAKAKRVRVACRPKEPETYEERQKRTDVAAFRDNQREWYRCAQEAGYQLTEPDEDGQFGLTEIGPDGDFQSPKIEACRKEAFKK